ncbi:MAG: Uncharacterised protein [Hyphomonas sp. TMED17]|nr:MAG: Uncharacterised protein [Hyphomonas sp. TMED17]
MTELCGIFEVRLILELVAHIAIQTEMMEKIIALENSVIGDHPVVLLRNEWLQYCRSNIGMIEAPERIANIVQQSTDNILLVPAIPVGACRCLK